MINRPPMNMDRRPEAFESALHRHIDRTSSQAKHNIPDAVKTDYQLQDRS